MSELFTEDELNTLKEKSVLKYHRASFSKKHNKAFIDHKESPGPIMKLNY